MRAFPILIQRTTDLNVEVVTEAEAIGYAVEACNNVQ